MMFISNLYFPHEYIFLVDNTYIHDASADMETHYLFLDFIYLTLASAGVLFTYMYGH